MTAQAEPAALFEEVQRYCALVEELLPRLEAEPVEDGGPALAEDARWQPSWASLALEVLDARHAVEERLHTGSGLTADLEIDLVEADEQLRSQLWRLTFLNEARQERLEALREPERERHWWYALGAHVPSRAVAHLGDVAAVVACFPEAHAELQALAGADAQLLPAALLAKPMGTERDAAVGASSPSQGFDEAAPAPEPFVAGAVDEDLWEEEEQVPSKDRGSWLRSPLLPWGAAAATVLCALSFGGAAYLRAAEQAREEKARLLEEAERLKAESDAHLLRLESAMKNTAEMSQAQRAALEAQLEQAKVAAETASRTPRPSSGSASQLPRSTASGSTASGSTGSGSVSAAPGSRPAKPGTGAACPPGDPMCGGM
jgi:hypothetical protein